MQKTYVEPTIKSEEIEIGVFGCYGGGKPPFIAGNPFAPGGKKKHKKNWWEALFWWI